MVQDKTPPTTIKVSRKLLAAIKKDGFMGETYENVLWRWKGKDQRKRAEEPNPKYQEKI